MSEEKNYFEQLYKVDVSERVEKKDTGTAKLSYLSWAFAWAEVKRRFPDAQYVIKKFGEKNLPYIFDSETGYMVFTEVTVEGITHEMWLPVMDSSNKAMLNHSYKYPTKKGERTVQPATMFDINKTIMRCLTKNIGMHGLGLYIYAGEDLPENEEGSFDKPKMTKESALKLKLTFGKHSGKTMQELFDTDKGYISWLKGNDKTDIEIKEAIALIEKPEPSTPEVNNKKEQTIPSKTVQQINDEIKEVLDEINKQGGDIKATQRLYLSTSGLESFENYNKTDFLDFLEEILSDMHVKQGELMKNGTTTANNVIDWGKSK